MKKLIVALVLFFSASLSFAQSPIGDGGKQLNFGTGFSNWGVPFYVGMDFGVHPDITVGFNASFRSYSEKWSGTKYGHTIIGLFANGNYHFNTLLNIPREWDFYAGISAGWVIWNAASGYDGSHASGFGIDAQIGGRYYWNDRWAVNLEFGGGNAASGGRIGLSYIL
ncbi:MAG TPA: hypothetical protein PKV88_04925 [Bacteroidales bacterium]|nr:hypothetical protein [Bacteroidales bacterium]MDD4086976.1 hypothetical protein [Bacteroidales bacterium]HPE43404.1 hypothetical protein [Bacteroidales bacterium]